jgi:uncharacterized protein
MIKCTGHADLPLHPGIVPKWLADRMMLLGTAIVETLIMSYGKKEVLIRLSDPLWFQSLGAVLGMDWHSSGITTSVMYALKRGINAHAKEFGICICGGRGSYSRKTPEEITFLCEATGLNGDALTRASRLCAKIDNTAVQDGYQLYQHNFILTDKGEWAVVQQGMNTCTKTARRYHWCSSALQSFVEEPHTGITGEQTGPILNLTDIKAKNTRHSILSLTREAPQVIIKEAALITRSNEKGQGQLFVEPDNNERTCIMPAYHDVRKTDIDLKRLGAVLATAYDQNPNDFESLLLTPGLGPRTLESLTLISEVIYGTPARFSDPARFSFAHGGKDGHPFPVACTIYDESIRILHDCITQSKLGYTDKSECLKRLHTTAQEVETRCEPEADFEKTIEHERTHSHSWGGRTCSGIV